MKEMSELKDTAIKLFGKTIALPLSHRLDDVASANESCSGEAEAAREESCDDVTTGFDMNKYEMKQEDQEGNWETSTEDKADDKPQDSSSNQINEDSEDPTTSGDPKTHSTEGDTKNGEESETSVSQEKTVKKPDKILPCPRCNSMDTKFCYYNNYNVNQPRHFCKNCQRYWTDGGTMRNVPVGAGRRKNKSSSASHYRHLMVSEALRNHAVNGVHSPSLINNGTVLTFGSDSPLCDSVASVLNLSENSQNSFRNGYHRSEQRILASRGGVTDNGDDCSSVSSVTANSNSSEKGCNAGKQDTTVKNYRRFPPQIPCFSGPPWPSYPWNSAMPPPSFSASGFPVSFYPAPTCWGCTVPSPWNLPSCLSPQSPSLNQCASSTSPTSPLGKHSRDGHIINPSRSKEPSRESNSSETSLLIPKTLRIDDPSEAAKSSILTTLGIKNEKSSSTNGGGLFRGFQTKNEERNYAAKASSVLQANPAALSRSLNFHFHERN